MHLAKEDAKTHTGEPKTPADASIKTLTGMHAKDLAEENASIKTPTG